jgi:hypothetical protein
MSAASEAAASDQQGWTTITSSDLPGVNNFFIGSTCATAWECWNVGGATANGPNSQLSGVIQRWNGST